MHTVPFLYVNVIALCCFGLLLAAFHALKKTPEITSFMMLLADGTAWMAGSVCMRLQIAPSPTFWYYVSLLSLFALVWFFYSFFLRFSKRREPLRALGWTIAEIALLIPSGMGLFLPPPTAHTTATGTVFLYTVTWRVAIPVLFVAFFTFYIFLDIRRSVREQGIYSPGLLLIIIGVCCVAVGNVAQVVIPGNVFPYDALGGIVFVFLLAFGMYKKRLFSMTPLASRMLSLLTMAGLCVLGAIYLVMPLSRELTTRAGLSEDTSLVIVTLVFVGVLLQGYSLINRLIGGIFSRQGEESHTLKQFAAEAAQTLSTGEIMEKLSASILSDIPVDRVYICLLEGSRYAARYCSSPLESTAFGFSADSPMITWLRHEGAYLLLSEFAATPYYLSVWESEKDLLRRMNIECVAAMRNGDEITGLILLPQRKNGKKFRCCETEYLETLSSVAAITMKNASLYEQMFREARIDSLTGAYNYRSFVEQEETQFRECRDDCISLLMADMDDFKLYNQLYGVKEGDEALRLVSAELNRCAQGMGTVFRTSGKVFAVLLPHQDARRAGTLAEEIQRRVAGINGSPERRAFKTLSVSIGICSAPCAASTAKELLDNADLATYNAKRGGKNCVAVFQGVTTVLPQQIAERTDAILNRVTAGTDERQNTVATISALTAAIDAKDHYTYAHSKNVARYAASLAVAAGLNDDQVRTIYSAGLLHDVGKISIPEDILNKTGKLTEQEFNIMKGHVNNSIEMIRHLPEMDYLVPAILGHHERWDGRGYPRGLAGEDIPITARCLAVADCFDAMTTDRPYRRGMSAEYALDQIAASAATQLDPHLAETFVQLVRGRDIKLSEQVLQR
jgi:diguanylate cyclase (GGDEF)-like protein/putative nucleotidyltransferase with HDIG domain